jgi:hypothetical protein
MPLPPTRGCLPQRHDRGSCILRLTSVPYGEYDSLGTTNPTSLNTRLIVQRAGLIQARP